MLKKIKNYFQSSLQEMKKVTWPTKEEATKHTLLVIGISLGIAAFLGGLDFLFAWLFEMVIK